MHVDGSSLISQVPTPRLEKGLCGYRSARLHFFQFIRRYSNYKTIRSPFLTGSCVTDDWWRQASSTKHLQGNRFLILGEIIFKKSKHSVSLSIYIFSLFLTFTQSCIDKQANKFTHTITYTYIHICVYILPHTDTNAQSRRRKDCEHLPCMLAASTMSTCLASTIESYINSQDRNVFSHKIPFVLEAHKARSSPVKGYCVLEPGSQSC